MNGKRQVKGKLGHVVQIRVCRLQEVNVSLTSLMSFTANGKRETRVKKFPKKEMTG